MTPPTTAPRVELLLVPNCPHGDSTRALLTHTLQDLGVNVEVIERIGEHASPTVLVDGLDVMTGTAPAAGGASCRLDLPTPERLRQAIGGGVRR